MRIEAMPAEQSGLLADAMKFTGELSWEPFAGDVTVTTGVVAKAVKLKMSNTETSTKGSRSRAQFIEKRPRNPVGRRDVEAICNAAFHQTIGSIPKKSRFHPLGAQKGGSTAPP